MPPKHCSTSRPRIRERALTRIDIETCAHCNRHCNFCPTGNTVFFPKEVINEELWQKLVTELADMHYAADIGLYGHNESTLDPQIVRRHQELHERVPRSRLTLSTNGDVIRKKPLLMLDLFDAGLQTMLFNDYGPKMDASQELSEAEFRERNYELHALALEHGIVVDIKHDFNWAFPMDHDPVGRKKIIFANTSRYKDGFPGICDRAGNTAIGVVGKKASLPLTTSCERPFNHIHIKWNGNMILCCQDWHSEHILGNVNEMTICEAYNSPVAEELRTMLDSGKRTGLCAKCDWGSA